MIDFLSNRKKNIPHAEDAPSERDLFSFRRFNANHDGEKYNLWRRDAWYCAHNTLDGYDDVYLAYAAVRARHDPDSVLIARYNGEDCGILELDVKRDLKNSSGWISFFYLTEQYRGRGLGRALMQKAEEIYKQRGRKKIALCAAVDNTRALGFYWHLGFKKTGEQMGALGPLLNLEKEIE